MATGSITWDSAVTEISCGKSTTAAQPAIAGESSPPKGNPTSTLARERARSLTVQPSSTAPEEKKKTSYGVIAAPNNATA
jgi:hypothetical protein